MKSGFINSGNQRLHYLQFGSGKKLLLTLHGYSNSASMFATLAGLLAQECTIISLDMPYHGQSSWIGEQPWTKPDLVAMVEALMQQFGVAKISLAGYSLGGRVCLMLAELIPQSIDRITLMAPDGLIPNRFYKFVTGNPAGKRLFTHFLEKPEGFVGFVSWLQERKIIDASKRKLVEQYASAGAARAFLKKVWPNLRLMMPDPAKVRGNIARYGIRIHIFMGKHDRVIPLKNAILFAAGEAGINVHVLDKGHRVMDEGSIHFIAKTLLEA